LACTLPWARRHSRARCSAPLHPATWSLHFAWTLPLGNCTSRERRHLPPAASGRAATRPPHLACMLRLGKCIDRARCNPTTGFSVQAATAPRPFACMLLVRHRLLRVLPFATAFGVHAATWQLHLACRLPRHPCSQRARRHFATAIYVQRAAAPLHCACRPPRRPALRVRIATWQLQLALGTAFSVRAAMVLLRLACMRPRRHWILICTLPLGKGT
jgi:hypothetical protein